MNNTSFASWVARGLSFALIVAGCGGIHGALGDADEEHTGKGEFAFTEHQADAWLTGCVGSPNGTCDSGENNFNCAQDCSCGDGQCNGTESETTCPVDCKYGSDPHWEDDFCGNSRCEPWEYDGQNVDCVTDCVPAQAPASCGDYTCEPGETSSNCPFDCGNTASCGNGSCEPALGETPATCDRDCTNFNVPGNRFKGTSCSSYELSSQYADGNGGTSPHLVTTLAAGCSTNAYPWSLVQQANQCNGSKLLKPDGTICTISGANCSYDAGWATLGTEYVMGPDPNDCGTFRYHSSSYYYGFHPMEWSKVGTKNCAQIPGGCTVYQCDGTSTQFTAGTRSVWRPQLAQWSIYANKCQP